MLIAWDTTRSDPLPESELAGRVTGKKRASCSPPYSENFTVPPSTVGSLTPRPQRDRESGMCQSGCVKVGPTPKGGKPIPPKQPV